MKALVLLSAWCGVRWGEVIELRRKDIDDDCEVLFVGRAVTHRGGCRIDTPKSGKPRAVVIPPQIGPSCAITLPRMCPKRLTHCCSPLSVAAAISTTKCFGTTS